MLSNDEKREGEQKHDSNEFKKELSDKNISYLSESKETDGD